MTIPAIVATAADLLHFNTSREAVREDVVITLIFEAFKGSDEELAAEADRLMEQAEKMNMSRRPS